MEEPQQSQNINISESTLKHVQVGGIAGRDLNVTQNQDIQNVHVTNVFGTVNIEQSRSSSALITEQEDLQWRRVLLNKVRSFWIEGILEESLHNKVLIDLGLQEQNKLTRGQLSKVQEFSSNKTDTTFPKGTTATEVFQNIGSGRTLLILGEPGAGKTVTLLKLAENLVARAENDLTQPLPVIVNLSSWANHRGAIDDWLVQELSKIYKVSTVLGELWIKKEQLILLLDGLDEVDIKYRNDCAQAINQFVQEYGLTELVICCRYQDYQNLPESLDLLSAIYVQPLNAEQIYHFIEQVGQSLIGLKEVLQENNKLLEFASSPLILSIMSLTYQGCSKREIITLSKADSQHHRLFENYIDRMMDRRGTTRQYSDTKTLSWLSWLASDMERNSKKIFFIEHLQPNSLPSRLSKFQYSIEIVKVSTIVIGISHIVIFLLMSVKPGYALIIGGGLGVISGLFIDSSKEIKLVETVQWSWKNVRHTLFSKIREDIKFASILSIILVVVASIFASVEFSITTIVGFLFLILMFAIGNGIFGVILRTPLAVVNGFVGPEIEEKVFPNQGIWSSALNARKFWRTFGIPLGMICGVTYGFLDSVKSGIIMGFFTLFIVGLITGLIGGGAACLQHIALRRLLHRKNLAPKNYRKFLDYAADRYFLQKVGGGYIFVHRMLQEHFAAMR